MNTAKFRGCRWGIPTVGMHQRLDRASHVVLDRLGYGVRVDQLEMSCCLFSEMLHLFSI